MKNFLLLFFALTFALQVLASDESEEKPVQHLKVADVGSMEDARRIFIEKTSEIKSKKKLDPVELEQIHIITYSLEKSVAYFAENLEGHRQELAKEIAVVVEDIHLDSENKRQEKIRNHLNRYFDLAERFIAGF
jgi:flagellar biosynthesis component FlhA